jgi:WXG100 family type VII secretion target
MANSIQVTTGTLTNKATELKNLNSKLKNQIEALKTAESSLNSMWDGEANDAFHKAFNQDVTQMNNFYNAIEKYVTSLQQIAKAYEKAEKANVNTATTRSYK